MVPFRESDLNGDTPLPVVPNYTPKRTRFWVMRRAGDREDQNFFLTRLFAGWTMFRWLGLTVGGGLASVLVQMKLSILLAFAASMVVACLVQDITKMFWPAISKSFTQKLKMLKSALQ